MRPALTSERERERFDRQVLQSALDGRHLPPFVPLEPSRMGAAVASADIVPVALDAIREAHGLDEWSPESFERVLVGDALRAWHGELETERRADGFVARARTCPVVEQASRDARVCQMCRAFRATAAQEAYGARLQGITFPRLVTRGDATCEMRLALAKEP